MQRQRLQGLARRFPFVNRARTAKFALSKADYATAILKIVGVCADNRTTHAALTEIISDLTDHDDRNGRAHSIKTEEHLNGLLTNMQKKLQRYTYNLGCFG